MAKDVRLQKYLSSCGVASRRKAEELILAGAVKVNGQIVALGEKIDPRTDRVTLHGKRVQQSEQPVYLMLNKPRGFVTTMADEQGRKCVADLVKDAPARVYPVGRLDRNSEGLLLMTNDGEFANTIMHPRSHVAKTYRVTVRPPVSEDQLVTMATGVPLDGRDTLPCKIEVLTKEEERVVLRFTLYEGRNREIRRLCEAVGLTVMRLKRTAIDTLTLGMLPQGKWRLLTQDEVKRLIRAASSTSQQKGRG
ncbi:MAG: rRNA pseudouridine synthase, partial [Clostridia bacterium]|nr:rRNA pseudouridine synthase [Clostridia bacterium]